MTRRWVQLVLLILASLATAPLAPASARDKTISVEQDDPAMNAAIAKARSSLPEFWQHLETPGPGEEGFALKVRVPYDGDSAEHFWLGGIERKDGKLSGIVDNDPSSATHVQRGQRYEFTEADISDWLYLRNGKMVGNETMRPLLDRMPKELADQYRQMMETP
jgi:uncharacterized protein YegJ (DUF2314 family)